ncbi:hypothetical protein ACN47E_003405 [Coniothyrium glycines]
MWTGSSKSHKLHLAEQNLQREQRKAAERTQREFRSIFRYQSLQKGRPLTAQEKQELVQQYLANHPDMAGSGGNSVPYMGMNMFSGRGEPTQMHSPSQINPGLPMTPSQIAAALKRPPVQVTRGFTPVLQNGQPGAMPPSGPSLHPPGSTHPGMVSLHGSGASSHYPQSAHTGMPTMTFPQHGAPTMAPPGFADPMMPHQGPLGANGQRARVPGQSQFVPGQFGSRTDDPEANFRHMQALNDLQRSNEAAGRGSRRRRE